MVALLFLFLFNEEPDSIDSPASTAQSKENDTTGVTFQLPEVYLENMQGQTGLGSPDEGEAVWRIQSAEDEAYLEQALAAGLRVVRRIDRLDLVLVEGPEDMLRRWTDAEIDAGFNVPIALPPTPAQEQISASQPVRDQLLEFFGLADRPSNWGEGVRVAILDTGVSEHPSLEGSNITVMQFGENDGGGDSNGHGTAVASLIVGNDSVAQGLAPSADLLIYQVLDQSGVGDAFGIASAIVAAVDAGAQVISLSAGSANGATVLSDAVAYAVNREVVIVAASGNEGSANALYPAAYPDVLSVGAVDLYGRPASFSNADPGLDISAPGVGVYTAYSNDQYVEFSGTSAATPIVASAVAALMSEEPLLSSQQAVEKLLAYADDAGAHGVDARTGAGVLNPLRVLNRNDPNLSDLGVSAPFLDPDASDETMATISLNVQNRGNQYISSGQAVVSLDGETRSFTVSGLETGDSVPIAVQLPAEVLSESGGVQFAVELSLGGGQSDDNRSNDGYDLVLKIDADE